MLPFHLLRHSSLPLDFQDCIILDTTTHNKLTTASSQKALVAYLDTITFYHDNAPSTTRQSRKIITNTF